MVIYDEWLKHVFNHPLPAPVADEIRLAHQDKLKASLDKLQAGEVTFEDTREHIKPQPWDEWYYQWDAPYIDIEPRDAVAYITRTFSTIDQIAENYSDGQMNQGIYYIINNGCSDYIFSLIDTTVPQKERIDAIYSMYSVYEKLYAKKCQAALGYLSEEPNPLNRTCYMWFDILPFYGKSDVTERDILDEPILQVMEKILTIPNEACQEGALHGLGHWQYVFPERVTNIINQYLAINESNVRPELAQYAKQARLGNIP